MSQEYPELEHQLTDNPPETSVGIEGYAGKLGLPAGRLLELVSGKDVMDLGSGRGTFAAELEMLRLSEDYKAPKSIISVNRRYKFGKTYDDFFKWREDALGDKLMLSLPKVEGYKRITVPYDDISVKNAWERSKKGWRDWDWNTDLVKCPDSSVDIIVSRSGFPYYSDLHHDIDDEKIDFGPQSKSVFTQLARILRPGGRMELLTDIDARAPVIFERFKKDFSGFLDTISCDLTETRTSTEGIPFKSLTIVKRIPKSS